MSDSTWRAAWSPPHSCACFGHYLSYRNLGQLMVVIVHLNGPVEALVGRLANSHLKGLFLNWLLVSCVDRILGIVNQDHNFSLKALRE
jgi:hypothetical protein